MTTSDYAATGLRLSAALATMFAVACVDNTPSALTVASETMESPAGQGSGEPFLSSGPAGLYLSWLEPAAGGGHDLRLSRLEDSSWSDPATVAHSDRFFVNWADFPSVSQAADGTLWAHWLERGNAGGYDYGVRLVHSKDGGRSWSTPWTPHDDTSPTEHGFVSAVAFDGGMGFAWLDGRRYAPGADGSAATNEMTLRYRFVGANGSPGPETLVDGRVCDCCQTDAALTDSGPIVVYRDRTEEEIRDIYVARLVDGAWTEGEAVHPDGWHIGGCPVNGPAVVASGSDAAVAWFTAPDDVPNVKVAFSRDGGATFGAPVVVDDGNPGGRVDLLMTGDGSVLVSWLERTEGDAADIRVRRVAPDGTISASATISSSSAGRASGFPRLAETADGAVVAAWTDTSGEASMVRVLRLRIGGQG